MERRARRAMQLLVLAEVQGICSWQEREKCVNAARAVLCEEFNDVRLYWRPTPSWEMWELVAAGPGGDFDRCAWSQVAK